MIIIDREISLDPNIINSRAPRLTVGHIGGSDVYDVIWWGNAGLLEEGQGFELTIFRLRDDAGFLSEMHINLQDPGQCTFLRLYLQQLQNLQKPSRRYLLEDYLMWGTKLTA